MLQSIPSGEGKLGVVEVLEAEGKRFSCLLPRRGHLYRWEESRTLGEAE